MKGFDHILNWKLLSGSHEFPGEGGGAAPAFDCDYRSCRS